MPIENFTLMRSRETRCGLIRKKKKEKRKKNAAFIGESKYDL